jgi:4-deoxy-L-threo-5-hexosulose-uronate ketol-isomerase
MNTRFAIHPDHFKTLETEQIRESFLIPTLFQKDLITYTYSHYDRMIIGGVQPISKSIKLESTQELKADFFLQRREMGINKRG